LSYASMQKKQIYLL